MGKVDIKDGKQEFPSCRMVSMTMEGAICPHPSMIGYESEMADMDPCVGTQHDNGTYDPALMVIEFDLCPDPVLTLGSAFGWVAMIELASTLVILAVAMPLGYVENDLSTWKTLINTVNEEENKRAIQQSGTDYVLESGVLQP